MTARIYPGSLSAPICKANRALRRTASFEYKKLAVSIWLLTREGSVREQACKRPAARKLLADSGKKVLFAVSQNARVTVIATTGRFFHGRRVLVNEKGKRFR